VNIIFFYLEIEAEEQESERKPGKRIEAEEQELERKPGKRIC